IHMPSPSTRSTTVAVMRPALVSRPGFALPLVILVIAVLTAALAAGFAASTAEFGTTSAQKGQGRAFAVAQSAMEIYMNSRDSLCAAVPGAVCIADISADVSSASVQADSMFVTVPGGVAEVVVHQLRYQLSDTIPAMYFLRSRGIDSRSRVSGRDTTKSQRTVGVMATYNTAVVSVMGAWTSLSGIKKQGTAGIVSGIDQCGKMPPVAG